MCLMKRKEQTCCTCTNMSGIHLTTHKQHVQPAYPSIYLLFGFNHGLSSLILTLFIIINMMLLSCLTQTDD